MWESVLSYQRDPREPYQVKRLGNRHLYQLGHLASPLFGFVCSRQDLTMEVRLAWNSVTLTHSSQYVLYLHIQLFDLCSESKSLPGSHLCFQYLGFSTHFRTCHSHVPVAAVRSCCRLSALFGSAVILHRSHNLFPAFFFFNKVFSPNVIGHLFTPTEEDRASL